VCQEVCAVFAPVSYCLQKVVLAAICTQVVLVFLSLQANADMVATAYSSRNSPDLNSSLNFFGAPPNYATVNQT
jgi:hypothetical protein